jgi:uncharacterized protein YegP (UPF0339 family)
MSAIYEIFKNHHGQYRFWLIADSGRILLTSEAYANKDSCKKAVAAAKKNASAIERFELKQSKNGKAYFVLQAEDHKPLGHSKLYSSSESLSDAIEIVRKTAPQSPINDLSASWH